MKSSHCTGNPRRPFSQYNRPTRHFGGRLIRSILDTEYRHLSLKECPQTTHYPCMSLCSLSPRRVHCMVFRIDILDLDFLWKLQWIEHRPTRPFVRTQHVGPGLTPPKRRICREVKQERTRKRDETGRPCGVVKGSTRRKLGLDTVISKKLEYNSLDLNLDPVPLWYLLKNPSSCYPSIDLKSTGVFGKQTTHVLPGFRQSHLSPSRHSSDDINRSTLLHCRTWSRHRHLHSPTRGTEEFGE